MSTQILLTLILIVATVASLKIISLSLKKIGELKRVNEKRIYYINKAFSTLLTLVSLFFLAFIWSVSFSGLLIFASSIFAVIGVALFAQWSILSNITSSIIIFFTFPSRVGDRISIMDGDNSLCGEIMEISLFQIEIKDTEGNYIYYPNNLFMQKPFKKLKECPKNKINETKEQEPKVEYNI